MSDLKNRINDDLKTAMKARDAVRVQALRLLTAAFKKKEVDERVELTDADVLAILVKEQKTRQDSVTAFATNGREDLAEGERFELGVIAQYLPQPLTEDELNAAINEAIAETGALGPKDMGKVMTALKPRVAGRTDMGALSGKLKTRLGAGA